MILPFDTSHKNAGLMRLAGCSNDVYQDQDKFIDYGLVPVEKFREKFGFNHSVRGPLPTSKDFIVCVGAAQTFGRYVLNPYPRILSEILGIDILNLSSGGAGPSRWNRPLIIKLLNQSKLVVLQFMSGRSVSTPILTIKDGGRTGIFSLTGEEITAEDLIDSLVKNRSINLLKTYVFQARKSYVEEYINLLAHIKVPVLLFWFSTREAKYKISFESNTRFGIFGGFPHLVDERMISDIVRHNSFVKCITSRGMPHKVTTEITNKYYPSPEMHEDAALVLSNKIKQII